MAPVVLGDIEVPTQMGLKGSAIEAIVGIAFMIGMVVFFVVLGFLRHNVVRVHNSRGRRSRRRAIFDAGEWTTTNSLPPPPTYDSLFPDHGRSQPQLRSSSNRWSATNSQPQNDSDTHNPPNAAVDDSREISDERSSRPNFSTLSPSVLPPYYGRDPHGLPSYETFAFADEEDRLRNTWSAVPTQVPQGPREDASLRVPARILRTEIMVTQREISPNEV
ncbi:hypothetical protein AYO21_08246 [Fonsecaea monophora]|uniref:Uncharacterized protein n=1 Tax=Fonsecaea monophora TaxID=254056 RepID=A0A177EZK9_9EURO|nr:hypothetical protein AYO21_08246 [Fonsecaea monophora]OAG37514.1 hypothetical protein AYO21_08246 [Fonsecaea monophora]